MNTSAVRIFAGAALALIATCALAAGTTTHQAASVRKSRLAKPKDPAGAASRLRDTPRPRASASR